LQSSLLHHAKKRAVGVEHQKRTRGEYRPVTRLQEDTCALNCLKDTRFSLKRRKRQWRAKRRKKALRLISLRERIPGRRDDSQADTNRSKKKKKKKTKKQNKHPKPPKKPTTPPKNQKNHKKKKQQTQKKKKKTKKKTTPKPLWPLRAVVILIISDRTEEKDGHREKKGT